MKINNFILRIKYSYEYLTHFKLVALNGKINIHNCTRHLHYWEEELFRGVYCSICGKTVSQETFTESEPI